MLVSYKYMRIEKASSLEDSVVILGIAWIGCKSLGRYLRFTIFNFAVNIGIFYAY